MKFTHTETFRNYVDMTAKKKIKSYLSDWIEYDRPKFYKLSFSGYQKNAYLILRTCGSYLFTETDILENVTPIEYMKYYSETDKAAFYKIDFSSLEVTKLKPETITKTIKKLETRKTELDEMKKGVLTA